MESVALYTLGVLVFVVGIAASIALHEVGHMWPAKKFGMKVTQYFVGFGKTIWSTRRGETEYGVKMIPLGGYVRIVGMLPPHKNTPEGTVRESNTGLFTQVISDAREAEYQEVRPEDQPRLFYARPWWQKLIVMSGGPAMNIVIAAALYGILIMLIGVQTPTTTIRGVSDCVIPDSEAGRECTESDAPTPASEAGLQPGDVLISFNGVEATDWEVLTREIRSNGGDPAEIVFERDGNRQTVTADMTVTARTALDDPETIEDVGFLGVTPVFERQRGGPLEVATTMSDVTVMTFQAILRLPERMVGVAQAAFGAERDPDGPVSVVGAGRVAGELTAQEESPWVDRASNLISLLAVINLFLAVFNLIPLLPLDGGHIAGAIYEAVRRWMARLFGRPDPGYVDVAKMLPVAYTVAVLLIVMSVILIYADIVNPVRLT